MLVWVVVALATGAVWGAVPGTPSGRQADFASAAREYGVPESVLLGVSYLESRWDANAGRPSTAGGFGPMHLVEPVAAPEMPRSGADDARGDESRPLPVPLPRWSLTPLPAGQGDTVPAEQGGTVAGGQGSTVREAARLTGLAPALLRRDPAANIRGGAALLASYGQEAGADPGGWYAAVSRYAGGAEFADEVFAVIREGAARRTDDGFPVRLEADPDVRTPGSGPMRKAAGPAECPASLACEWMPAAYRRTGKDDYGNHDKVRGTRRIDYIVIHDTEGTYQGVPSMVSDPHYVSWHYTVRSRDGHVAQHVPTKDIAWHAGNWDVNRRSIGIEHEGYLARAGTWYTEAMYRSSARLVRYLAARHHIPLDRAHILGHDNVPGTTPETVPGMHDDPGPYWDWAHYFELMGHPFKRAKGGDGTSVVIRPSYDENRPRFEGCRAAKPDGACRTHGASSVWLRTEPRADAPLVDDIGERAGKPGTYSVYDHSARASTGQRYAVAERRGDWTAIWYLGAKAWFHNPAGQPTAVPARGPLVTPVDGKVRVYGRAYPEKSAYRGTGAAYQPLTPLPYVIRRGQSYALGLTLPGSYYAASSFKPAKHVTVTGEQRYHQIQLGHRVMFVLAKDVRVIR